MSSDQWVPETRPVPEELTDTFGHEVYPPAAIKFPTIVDQLDNATAETLRLWAAGGTGESNYRHTEIGNE